VISTAGIAVRYVLFAAIATAVNLGTQHAVLALWPALPPAMAAGTVAGLVAKYGLDKRWIFADPSTGFASHGRKFALYTAMGLFTTAIFWGFELAFAQAFDSAVMRDLGAILGLAVGYVTKYRLDRRFVFTDGQQA
jgi:putative flippase GtrA